MFHRDWWCGLAAGTRERMVDRSAMVIAVVHPASGMVRPAFLTDAEVARADHELAALSALGPAPNYLAREAVAWARARPRDPDAAEALARAVEGTRRGCRDEDTAAASRRAFQALHQLFPRTEWAQRTKYWY
jgi:hypothetical protein